MLVLTLVAAFAAPTPADHVDALVSAQVRGLMSQVEALRQLQFKGEVPVSVEPPEVIRAETLAELAEEDAQESLAQMSHTLTAFHMAAPDFDLVTMYTDIMGEALGGYYDPEERRLVLVQHGDMFVRGGLLPGTEETFTASHELVHALQDQHFGLLDLNDRETEDDDADLAITALIEGDATLAMMLVEDPGLLQHLTPAQRAELARSLSGEGSFDDTSAFGRAPRVVRESVLFPYSRGLLFAMAVHERGGWGALDAAYKAVPLSSEQILHPERYLRDEPDWPIRLELPELTSKLGPGWTVADINTLGEAGIRSWLRDSACPDEAAVDRAATGWGGDRYAALVGPGGAHALAWVSTWDSARDAKEAEAALGCAAATAVQSASVDAASWAYGDLASRVLRRKQDVIVLLDLPQGALPAVTAALVNVPRRTFTRLDDIAPPREPEG